MSPRRATTFALPTASLLAILLVGGMGDARADGYIGAGMGSASELEGDIASNFTTDEQASNSRIVVGERFGSLAVEGSLFGTQLHGGSAFTGEGEFTTISLGVDLKYYVGLVGGLEAYGKIGLNRTWLSGPAAQEDWNYQGHGEALGVGLQYSFHLPLTEVGLWLDYTAQKTELRDGDNQPLDGRLGMANLGLSLGF